MIKGKAASIYARTLLEAASDGKVSADVSADMHALADTFQKLPVLNKFLANPIRSSDDKAKLLAPAVAKFSPLTRKFLKLLDTKNRLALLAGIAEQYIALEEKKQNIERAVVFSAAALGADQLTKLSRALEARRPGKKVILTNQIDTSLIAGFRIQEGDTITDASIKNKLEIIRQKLAA
jgi:F-type H+-transporting ATPase subunit delta